jgi:oligosaccharide repeat unit polymerase
MIKQGLFAYLTIRSLYLASLGEAQILMHIENCCRYGLALTAITYFIRPSKSKGVIFGLIFSLELISGLFSGMKSHVIVALLIVSIVYFYSKKIVPKGMLLALILTLILINPFTSAYRDLINKGAIDTTSFESMFEAVPDVVLNSYTGNTFASIFDLGYQLTTSRLSMLESFSVIIKDISQSGEFWYGRYYVYFPILVFVPRIIWQNKPVVDLGLWFTQTYWNPNAFHSTAITYPGDFYLNFGLTGVLLGMFFTGIIYRFVYERFKMNVSPSALFIYIFVFLAITNYEGDFVNIYGGAIKQLVELFIISYFVFRKETKVPLR